MIQLFKSNHTTQLNVLSGSALAGLTYVQPALSTLTPEGLEYAGRADLALAGPWLVGRCTEFQSVLSNKVDHCVTAALTGLLPQTANASAMSFIARFEAPDAVDLSGAVNPFSLAATSALYPVLQNASSTVVSLKDAVSMPVNPVLPDHKVWYGLFTYVFAAAATTFDVIGGIRHVKADRPVYQPNK